MRLSLRITLLLLGSSLLAAALGAMVTQWTVVSLVEPLERARQAESLTRTAERFEHRVDNLMRGVSLLRDGLPWASPAPTPVRHPSHLGARLGSHVGVEAATLDHLFEGLMRANPEYLQVRLIEAPGGQELVRWERQVAGRLPFAVPAARLQNKAHRGCVQAAVHLAPGELHVSRLDLNRERGAIQVPHVPVLRVCAPLYAGPGAMLGMVAINVDMRPALAAVAASGGAAREVYLARLSDGSFLVHPDPDARFGAELGRPTRYQDAFPALTGAAARGPDVARSFPIHSAGDTGRVLAAAMRVDIGGQGLLLISVQHASAANAWVRARRVALWVGLGMGLVSGLLGFLVARPLLAVSRAIGEYTPGDALCLPPARTPELGTLARGFRDMFREVEAKTVALKQEREQFRRLVLRAPVAMLVVDSAGRIALANERASQLFGASMADLQGGALSERVPDLTIDAGDLAIRPPTPNATPEGEQARPAAATQTAQPTIMLGQRSDGAILSLEVTATPVEDAGRSRVLLSLVDVTLKERATEELLRSNQALSDFAHLASHDLQEPLRMVSGYVDLVRHHYSDRLDDRGKRFLERISDGAQRMAQLITQLLAYSRVGATERPPERVRSREIVEGVCTTLSPLLEQHGATVELGYLPPVMAEPVLLGEVFQNLISNAVKFRSEAPPHIEIGARRDGASVRFVVSDNGIGMRPEATERIFQMFQRLHARGAYAGSGIGLAFARRIVEQFDGKMWCESAPGQGSRFYFTLQAAAEEASEASQASA